MRQYFEPTDYAHLYREKNSGIYYARVDSRKGGRKTIRRSLKTKELTEAIAKMAAFLQGMGADTPAIGHVSWYVAVDTYIAHQKMRPNLKPKAVESAIQFASHARRLVDQDMAADAITPGMCRSWWAKKAQSCSPRTANGALGAVRGVFKMLLDSGAVHADPSSSLERMPIRPKQLNIPSNDDLRRIVAEILRGESIGARRGTSRHSSDMVAFLAYSGLRIEEARQLTWGDIGNDVISVPAIKHSVRRRVLYINASLREVIDSLRTCACCASTKDPVFHILTPRKALERACERLGLPHVRVHDLRHFFATTCIEQGVDIPTVAKWLGHQDGGALAMRVYGHLRDEHSKEQASRLRF